MSKPFHYEVGCDAHKHSSLFAVLDHRGRTVEQTWVNHEPGANRAFLSRFPEATPVALETVGNWYWIVDEIEQAGCVPLLAHAQMAKNMMGHMHKTDRLDAEGLAILQPLGSLPTVWIALHQSTFNFRVLTKVITQLTVELLPHVMSRKSRGEKERDPFLHRIGSGACSAERLGRLDSASNSLPNGPSEAAVADRAHEAI